MVQLATDSLRPALVPRGRRKNARYPAGVRLVVASLLAIVALGSVVALRASGQLYGLWVLALFALMLVLVPVSKHLSGRILWTSTVIFGFVPLLWWIPIDWPQNSRSTVLLAFVTAVVVFSAVWLAPKPGGLRRFLPRISSLDLVPGLAAAGGIFVFWHGLMVRRFDDAMALLLMSWDNASHFNIFHMQRIHGTVLPLAGMAPDGSRWALSDYPQGFHSLLVLITEMSRPVGSSDWETDVVNFTNFTAVMNIATIVLVVAAVCSIPALRKAPVVGVPVAIFVGSGWTFGFGALASMHGFSNFMFTAAMVAAAIVLCQSMIRVLDPIPLIAVGACVSAIMQNWVLSGVFLVPSLLAVLFATPKGRWKANAKELLIALVVVLLVAVAAATAATQLLTVKAEGILFASGGVPALNFGLLLALLGALGGAALIMAGGRLPASPKVRRIYWSIGAIWLGLAVALCMAFAQIWKNGSLSYYMLKFSIALALLVLVGLALAVGGILVRRQGAGDGVELHLTRRMVAASLLVSLGLSQLFGFILPLKDIGLPPTAESGMEWENQSIALSQGSPPAARILQAVQRSAGLHGPVMYLTTNQAEVDVILAQQWFDGLRGSYSEHSWNLSLNMFPLSKGAENLREVVLAIRAEDPTAQLVVDPENQEALEEILRGLQ